MVGSRKKFYINQGKKRKVLSACQVWCYTPIIPALGRKKQKD
jgi:hypothetical protein